VVYHAGLRSGSYEAIAVAYGTWLGQQKGVPGLCSLTEQDQILVGSVEVEDFGTGKYM